MSEKRKKRTRKANNQSVRSLQARPGESGLQAETESMPQQEGQVVAETDTKIRTKGGKMYGNSFMDKIREHKTTIIQVIVVAAIAVIVCAIMTPQLAPSKADYTATITALKGEDARASASINTLGTTLGDQIDDIATEVQGYNTTLDILGTKAATNSYDIGMLQDWKTTAEPRIVALEAEGSSPEGYLTGNVGNYTLYAKCSQAGNFTANVHLVYSPTVAVGNTTIGDAVATFYGSINWTTPAVKNYVPVLTYNSTAWFVSQVWFNIGTFTMTTNNVTALTIVFSGLNSTYTPSFAYVEVWPVLK